MSDLGKKLTLSKPFIGFTVMVVIGISNDWKFAMILFPMIIIIDAFESINTEKWQYLDSNSKFDPITADDLKLQFTSDIVTILPILIGLTLNSIQWMLAVFMYIIISLSAVNIIEASSCFDYDHTKTAINVIEWIYGVFLFAIQVYITVKATPLWIGVIGIYLAAAMLFLACKSKRNDVESRDFSNL